MKRAVAGVFLIIVLAVLVLRLALPNRVSDVGLIPRGIQTNSSGTLCLLLAITNSSSTRTYGIGFATQTKSGNSWEAPSSIKHFNLVGAQTLLPGSTAEVLVPVPKVNAPWRVAAVYFEHDQIPSDQLGKIWRDIRFRLGQFRKFITTPEISPNPTAAFDGATRRAHSCELLFCAPCACG